ncbi:hypothetical protein HanIR_Chr10g0483241 [Helianthus annuus]|nr:hypothetical protein HanIR_Chr10g0483241 [Helianthus annuus]
MIPTYCFATYTFFSPCILQQKNNNNNMGDHHNPKITNLPMGIIIVGSLITWIVDHVTVLVTSFSDITLVVIVTTKFNLRAYQASFWIKSQDQTVCRHGNFLKP